MKYSITILIILITLFMKFEVRTKDCACAKCNSRDRVTQYCLDGHCLHESHEVTMGPIDEYQQNVLGIKPKHFWYTIYDSKKRLLSGRNLLGTVIKSPASTYDNEKIVKALKCFPDKLSARNALFSIQHQANFLKEVCAVLLEELGKISQDNEKVKKWMVQNLDSIRITEDRKEFNRIIKKYADYPYKDMQRVLLKYKRLYGK